MNADGRCFSDGANNALNLNSPIPQSSNLLRSIIFASLEYVTKIPRTKPQIQQDDLNILIKKPHKLLLNRP